MNANLDKLAAGDHDAPASTAGPVDPYAVSDMLRGITDHVVRDFFADRDWVATDAVYACQRCDQAVGERVSVDHEFGCYHVYLCAECESDDNGRLELTEARRIETTRKMAA